ncbi:MAG: tetratricopeptide repeat protein [Flavobacteriales bacterium]|nr:tetratricopeptide repeat protein [Flavobacteriales bacterium]
MRKILSKYLYLLPIVMAGFQPSAFSRESAQIDSLNLLLVTAREDTNKVDLLVALAKQFEADNPKQVLEYMKEALPLADGLDYKDGLFYTYSLIGVAHSDLGEYNLAHKFFAIGLPLAEEIGDLEKISSSCGYKGVAFLKQGDFQKGLAWFFKTLDVNRAMEDTSRIATVLSNIGSCFQMQQNYRQALIYYQESLDIVNGLGYRKTEASNHLSMGAAHYNLGNIEMALKLYLEALNLYEQLGDKKNLALCYENLAIINFTDGDGTKALNYFLQALKINEDAGDKYGMIYSYSNIGTLYSEWGSYEKAVEYSEKSILLALEIGAKNELKETYKALSNIYEKSGNISKAYLNYKRYNNIKDSLFNERMSGQIAEMQTKHELDRKEHELEISDQEKQLLAKDNHIKEFRLYMLVVGIIGLFVIGVLVVNKLMTSLKITRGEKHLAEEEIKFKNRELENFAMRIVEKNEFLEQLKSTITNLHTRQEFAPEVRQISNTIQHNLYLDHDRRELEIRINQVNQAFLHKLDNYSSGLSKAEKRLCSLLMLELSSKDIAAVLNITPESVKVNRNRLRKKLQLEPHANIADFLKEL